jgi:hypothetical protein
MTRICRANMQQTAILTLRHARNTSLSRIKCCIHLNKGGYPFTRGILYWKQSVAQKAMRSTQYTLKQYPFIEVILYFNLQVQHSMLVHWEHMQYYCNQESTWVTIDKVCHCISVNWISCLILSTSTTIWIIWHVYQNNTICHIYHRLISEILVPKHVATLIIRSPDVRNGSSWSMPNTGSIPGMSVKRRQSSALALSRGIKTPRTFRTYVHADLLVYICTAACTGTAVLSPTPYQKVTNSASTCAPHSWMQSQPAEHVGY